MSLVDSIKLLGERLASEFNSVWSAISGKADSSHNHSGVYEPTFSKNTAFNKNFGTAPGTVCQGNDSRLSNARTPTAHTHTKANITDFAHSHAIGDLPVATSGSSSSTQVVRADDSRLSNARTPTAHNHTLASLSEKSYNSLADKPSIPSSKSDIGLGNVENFRISTQAEAEAGTVDDKYMTPLKTKQAIEKLPGGGDLYSRNFRIRAADDSWLIFLHHPFSRVSWGVGKYYARTVGCLSFTNNMYQHAQSPHEMYYEIIHNLPGGVVYIKAVTSKDDDGENTPYFDTIKVRYNSDFQRWETAVRYQRAHFHHITHRIIESSIRSDRHYLFYPELATVGGDFVGGTTSQPNGINDKAFSFGTHRLVLWNANGGFSTPL